jgi:hypothetical protein
MQHLDPVFKKLKQLEIFDIAALREMVGVCIPWFLVWLLCSYLFFHCFLNLVAELICFANRRFYDGKMNFFCLLEIGGMRLRLMYFGENGIYQLVNFCLNMSIMNRMYNM